MCRKAVLFTGNHSFPLSGESGYRAWCFDDENSPVGEEASVKCFHDNGRPYDSSIPRLIRKEGNNNGSNWVVGALCLAVLFGTLSYWAQLRLAHEILGWSRECRAARAPSIDVENGHLFGAPPLLGSASPARSRFWHRLFFSLSL